MSNEYGFFASKDHDRRYSADDFSAFFGDFFTNGVLGSDASALMVSAAGDMDVSIAAGTAYINGHWYRKQSAQVLTLGDSDKVSKRIDAVVIRCDLEKRMVYPFIIEGVPDETAVEPAPVRNERCYDIVLAYIAVAANCVEITAADIADKRGFDDLCGFVTSAIDHIDTKALFAQYEARWKLLEAGCAQDAEAVIAAWSKLGNVKTVNGVEPDESGNIDVITKNIDGIPVDLTGIYNTQMIGYDEEQGKLVPMNAVARTQTLLPSYEEPKIYESEFKDGSTGTLNTNGLGFSASVGNNGTFILKFNRCVILSGFMNCTVNCNIGQGNGTYNPRKLKIIFSKNADFSSIDAEYVNDSVVNGSSDNNFDITNLKGNYFIKVEFAYNATYSYMSFGISGLTLS